MSEKILHERMRDAAPQLYDRKAGLTGDGYPYAIMMRDDLLALADEIERDYISRAEHEAILRERTDLVSGSSAHWAFKAWADSHDMPFEQKQTITEWLDKWFHKKPLDENGNPWNIGDDCTQGGEDATVVGYRSGEKVFIDFHDERMYARCRGGDIKRQAPKLLDADGIEINVGDTVFSTDNTEWKVKRIRGCVVDLESNGGSTYNGHEPQSLTHQKPVLGADGVRICAGDTVYLDDKVSGTHAEPCVVASVTPDGTLWWEGGGCAPARLFTNKEPDSLEKLLDEMQYFGKPTTELAALNEAPTIGQVRDWADRLTALMERGEL